MDHKSFREMLRETYVAHRKRVFVSDILYTLTHMRKVIALAKVGFKAMVVYQLGDLLRDEEEVKE